MSLQGLLTPTMEWSSSNANESYENFKVTCELIFEGPVSNYSNNEKRKLAYLKLWCGEEGRTIIKTWDLTEDEQTLENYWVRFCETKK